METGIFDGLVLLAMFSPIIPVCLITIKLWKAPNIILGALLFGLMVNLSTDLVSLYLSVNGLSNHLMLDYYSIAFGLSTLFLFYLLNRSTFISKVILLYAALLILEFVLFEMEISLFVSWFLDPYFVLSLMIISISLMYFFNIFNELKIERIESEFSFWLNCAFLIYFASTLFLSLIKSVIFSDHQHLHWYLWPIQLVATIVFNLLVTIGVWVKMRK